MLIFFKVLFWFSLFFIAYTYLLYPLILLVWAKLRPKEIARNSLSPAPLVSVIMAVRNEEGNIAARIENLLNQDFPAHKMEIIIISDGSHDETNNIIRRALQNYQNTQANGKSSISVLKFLELEDNMGKPHALNLGVQKAKGEFLVFTDVRQRFESNAIRELIANFNDPNVGCVSGELVFRQNSDSPIKSEMGFYWDLEKCVRKLEARVHSVPGVTGCIYAIRTSLFEKLPPEILLDDVFVPMKAVLQGYRAVFDERAIAYDTFSKNMSQEKRRKIRTLLGNYQLMKIIPGLLSPKTNPIFLAYLSHKIFRLFIPFFFLIVFFTSLLLDGFIYKLVLTASIITMLLPLIPRSSLNIPLLRNLCTMASTFVLLNYFALLAFIYLLWHRKKSVW
jgi:cellulose synthase/poly-beta-1,6-N-acetylglucosamine synthase-like glycosyltransferase